MSEIGLNELGYDEQLYILAFDHRGSFEKMVGDVANVPGAKRLIWEGFQQAVSEGAPKEFSGVLVDDQYGSDVAQAAKAGGYKLAMPVEKSGQNEFDFQHGDRFGEVIEQFDPDFSKVLVRYNPEGDAEMNERQSVRLVQLSEWLHQHHRKFLFELLVPAEPAQLEQVGGSDDRYDGELRPQLMLEAILQLQNAGVEPDIWKIEGIDDRESCNEIAQLVRRDGRDRVSCVVLGRAPRTSSSAGGCVRPRVSKAMLASRSALDLRRRGEGLRGGPRGFDREGRGTDREQVPPLLMSTRGPRHGPRDPAPARAAAAARALSPAEHRPAHGWRERRMPQPPLSPEPDL